MISLLDIKRKEKIHKKKSNNDASHVETIFVGEFHVITLMNEMQR